MTRFVSHSSKKAKFNDLDPGHLDKMKKTRPDTRRVVMSLHHLGRSSVQRLQKPEKKCNGRGTGGWTDGPTKRGVESYSMRLEKERSFKGFITN